MTSRGSRAASDSPTTPSGPSGPGGVAASRGETPLFPLLAASFLSMVDRSTLPPMLTVLAVALGASIGEIGAALSAYAVAYAISQLAWSAVSSRIGQIRVLRIGLIAGAAFTLLTAASLGPEMVWISRALSGLAIGAVVPATLVFVGDRVALRRRGFALANLATAVSLGATIAVVFASVLGPIGAWRWVFAGTAVAELLTVILLWRIDPGPRPTAPVPFLRSARRVLADGWALLVFLLVAVEGALLFGIMGFLPAAMTATGADPVLSGIVTAAYGLAVIGAAQLVKLVLGRIPPPVLLLVGGCAAIIGFAMLTLHVNAATVLTASVLFGVAWAVAHTQVQNWLTDAVWQDRPVGTALFATAMFTGGAIGAAVGSAAATAGAYQAMFLGATIAAVAFTFAATIGRARYAVRAD